MNVSRSASTDATNAAPAAPMAAGGEFTLDPADWETLRAIAHRAVDDSIAYLRDVRERPVWRPIPSEVETFLARPLPQDPTPLERVYEDFQKNVFPYPMGNIHPRFWGWVIGTGTPTGALAEFLAAVMNPNVGGGAQLPHRLELQTCEWLKELVGFPQVATGLLVSGGSMANFVGLAVARNARAEIDVNQKGLAAAPRPMTLYASSEVHNSVDKMVGLLGLGRDALRKIPVDREFRIDVAALRRAIADDHAAGMHPFCVVGTAGTVNTGAIDDLTALADLCAEEKLWFHVDGAFGALAACSPSQRHLVRGMERADSLAFDLHKWLCVPFEAGAVFVRHPEAHHETFSVPASYLAHIEGGLADFPTWLSDYGLQLSRGFRALKVWMSFSEYGAKSYARLVEQNCAQAAYLAERVEREPELELLAPVPLNVVCFRYRGRVGGPAGTADGGAAGAIDDARLNEINQKIMVDLQEEGIAMPSQTILDGRFALRCAIVNHRSRFEDFDLLADDVLKRGRALIAQS
jgi:glutamate/tyrosine decarboxylase-like PLP-dependent enzyme